MKKAVLMLAAITISSTVANAATPFVCGNGHDAEGKRIEEERFSIIVDQDYLILEGLKNDTVRRTPTTVEYGMRGKPAWYVFDIYAGTLIVTDVSFNGKYRQTYECRRATGN